MISVSSTCISRIQIHNIALGIGHRPSPHVRGITARIQSMKSHNNEFAVSRCYPMLSGVEVVHTAHRAGASSMKSTQLVQHFLSEAPCVRSVEQNRRNQMILDKLLHKQFDFRGREDRFAQCSKSTSCRINTFRHIRVVLEVSR